MTFANCPKCGSSDVTTAGVCANCGWTRFPQVMGAGESKEAIYNLVGEIEIKVTGKALLDDYKRLLFENNSLTAHIAELETMVDELKPYRDGYEGEFLEPTDDRFYLIRHTNGQLVTTRKVDNHEDINFLGWGAKGKPRRYWRLPEVQE